MALYVLYDLVERKFGPTSENPSLLSCYDWRGKDPNHLAVLPVMDGFLLRVSKKDADRERRKRGLPVDE